MCILRSTEGLPSLRYPQACSVTRQEVLGIPHACMQAELPVDPFADGRPQYLWAPLLRPLHGTHDASSSSRKEPAHTAPAAASAAGQIAQVRGGCVQAGSNLVTVLCTPCCDCYASGNCSRKGYSTRNAVLPETEVHGRRRASCGCACTGWPTGTSRRREGTPLDPGRRA